MKPLGLVTADAIHPYLTASKFYPADMPAAWSDGKRHYILVQQANIQRAEQMTLADYCAITGAKL